VDAERVALINSTAVDGCSGPTRGVPSTFGRLSHRRGIAEDPQFLSSRLLDTEEA
jgi:hypothetical protein